MAKVRLSDEEVDQKFEEILGEVPHYMREAFEQKAKADPAEKRKIVEIKAGVQSVSEEEIKAAIAMVDARTDSRCDDQDLRGKFDEYVAKIRERKGKLVAFTVIARVIETTPEGPKPTDLGCDAGNAYERKEFVCSIFDSFIDMLGTEMGISSEEATAVAVGMIRNRRFEERMKELRATRSAQAMLKERAEKEGEASLEKDYALNSVLSNLAMKPLKKMLGDEGGPLSDLLGMLKHKRKS